MDHLIVPEAPDDPQLVFYRDCVECVEWVEANLECEGEKDYIPYQKYLEEISVKPGLNYYQNSQQIPHTFSVEKMVKQFYTTLWTYSEGCSGRVKLMSNSIL